MLKEITIKIDTDLLQEQRSWLHGMYNDADELGKEEIDCLDGLSNMMDAMIDQAEGFNTV